MRVIFNNYAAIMSAVIFSGIPEYLKLTHIVNVPPLFYALAFILLISAHFAIYDRRSLTNKKISEILQRFISIHVCLIIFVTLSLFSLLYHDFNFVALEDLSRRVSTLIFLGMLLIFISSGFNLRRDRPSVDYLAGQLRWGVTIGGVALAGSVLLGVYQVAFVTPGSCRMGGFYMNANGAAYALVLAIWFGSQSISSALWRSIFQAFLMIALLLTMSRSGFIMAVVMLTPIAVMQKSEARTFLKSFILMITLGAGLAWFQGQLSQESCLWYGVKDRMVTLEADGGEFSRFTLDAGSGERIKLTAEAWNRFKDNIVTGAGIDAQQGERSHNFMLALMSQHGLAGMVLFVLFWISLLWNGLPKSLAAGLFVASMFDHNFLYNRYVLIALASGIGVAFWISQREKTN